MDYVADFIDKAIGFIHNNPELIFSGFAATYAKKKIDVYLKERKSPNTVSMSIGEYGHHMESLIEDYRRSLDAAIRSGPFA